MRMGKINRAVLLAAVSQQPKAKKQVRDLANKVRDDARRLAPKDTGALRRSIVVVNVYDPQTKTVSYRVGWDKNIAWYGMLVEFGTEDTPARPHLRPAADMHGGVTPAGGD
jgi:HK97 gp10 family phage protein